MRTLVIEKVKSIQQKLKRPPLILDIGGGYFPFALATHIVDTIAYDDFLEIYKKKTYSKSGIWGGDKPNFSRDT